MTSRPRPRNAVRPPQGTAAKPGHRRELAAQVMTDARAEAARIISETEEAARKIGDQADASEREALQDGQHAQVLSKAAIDNLTQRAGIAA